MVVKPEDAKRLPKAWYICALLYYQGKQNEVDLWTVGLLRRSVTLKGIQNSWDYVENLSFKQAQDMLKDMKPRLVRATAGDIRKVVNPFEVHEPPK